MTFFLEKVISTNNIDIPFTDHKGVFVDASYNIVTKGKGFWKFNNTMLRNKEYVDLINSKIE